MPHSSRNNSNQSADSHQSPEGNPPNLEVNSLSERARDASRAVGGNRSSGAEQLLAEDFDLFTLLSAI